MLTLKKIAITGGISSGKTTVLRFFEDFGACVVSADAIVHDLLSHSLPIKDAIKNHFGDGVFTQREIDREKLANAVFPHPEQLNVLEKLLHPKVKEKVQESYEKAGNEKFPLFIAEIPLLFETNGQNDFDASVLIDTPIDESLKRFCSKGGSEEQFYSRLKRQMPLDEKRLKANHIIDNARSLEETKAQALKIYQNFLQGSQP